MKIWLLLGIGFSGTLFAANQTVILSGMDTEERHENVSRLAYESSKIAGREVHVAAGDGKWKFAKPEEMGPARTEKEVEDQIAAAAAKLKPGDSLTLFINDHGTPPYDDLDPLTSGFVIGGQAAVQVASHPLPNQLPLLATVAAGKKAPAPAVHPISHGDPDPFSLGLNDRPANPFLSPKRDPDYGGYGNSYDKNSGHGGAGSSKDKTPVNDGLETEDPHHPSSAHKITNAKLLEMLKKHVPETSRVKLVGIQCFPGGLHSVAFDLPNACASTSTDFKTATNSLPDYNYYGKGFWEEFKNQHNDLDKDSKTSLFEAHLSGAASDIYNDGAATLSSSDYINYVLHEGPYSALKDEGKLALQGTKGETGARQEDGLSRKKTEDHVVEPKERLSGGQHYELKAVPAALAALDKTIEDLKVEMTSGKSLESLVPKSVAELIKTRLSSWEKDRDQIKVGLETYNNEYEALKKEWSSRTFEDQVTAVDRFHFQTKLEDLNQDASERLWPLVTKYSVPFKQLSKLDRFAAKATDEQKKKFKALLLCETEPL